MKNLKLYFCVVLTVIGMSTVISSRAQFLNGDMSLGDQKPEGWSVGYTASGKLLLTRDTQVFKVGPSALCLSSVGGPAEGAASHNVEVTHRPFTISGWAMTSGNPKAAMIALQVFGDGKQIGWINLASSLQDVKDWQYFSQHVTLPDEANGCSLVVTLSGDGQARLDEVTMVYDGEVAAAGSTNSPPAPAPPSSANNTALSAPSPVINDAAPLPTKVPPSDPNLLYQGRFDMSHPDGPKCAWSASTVGIKFKGTDVNVKLGDSGDRWQIEVDGSATSAFSVHGGQHLYSIASGLADGEHTVRLVKATEPNVGTAQILGFELNQGASLLPLAAPNRRLEVIGDSISCGFGNEAHGKDEPFSPKTENAYYTYGAIAARQAQADYRCIAWSGRLMWPKNTIPEIYDRILPWDANSKWDFSSWTPDAVVINLATNDFAAKNPEEGPWTGAYEQFIARVRKNYPNAEIYCAIGPMMGDWGASKPLTTLRAYIAKIISDEAGLGDSKVKVIDFGIQDGGKNGFGARWHPTVKTHKLMADELTSDLKRDLGW